MELWCSVCDCVTVNSEDKTTGTIYEAHGHVIYHKEKEAREYETIIFAICKDCKLTEEVKPTTLKLKEYK